MVKPWWPALAWAAVIFGLSSVPGSAIPEMPLAQADKLAHGVVYSVLGFLCGRTLRANPWRFERP